LWPKRSHPCSYGNVKTVRGPQYGSAALLTLALVVPIALVFGLLNAFGAISAGVPISCSVVMVAGAWWIRRSSVVSVDDSGVIITMAVGKLVIPWTDIEALDGHRLSARLLRRSNGKRVFFAMLDPGWKHRPVTLAIQQRLAASTPG
jgi:hypothetical protein